MNRRHLVLAAAIVFSAASAVAQRSFTVAPAYQVPPDVAVRPVDIYSDGTRMAGQFYSPKKLTGQKLPTIIMAHGWAGLAAYLEPDAIAFAQAGYLVLTFDYRGWGPSDSRVVLTTKREPVNVQNYRFQAEVQEVREEVAPLNMVWDWQNALAFAVLDAQCDAGRIGLWGSSLSGGLVVSVAERDARVRAVHSQVAALDGRWVLGPQMRDVTYAQTSRRALEDTPYPSPGSEKLLGLEGVPILEQFASWAPVEDIDRIPNTPIQFVLAGADKLVDNKENGLRAYALVKGPKNLVVLPGIDHFDIYNSPPARAKARELAITWFDRYLKSAGSPAKP